MIECITSIYAVCLHLYLWGLARGRGACVQLCLCPGQGPHNLPWSPGLPGTMGELLGPILRPTWDETGRQGEEETETERRRGTQPAGEDLGSSLWGETELDWTCWTSLTLNKKWKRSQTSVMIWVDKCIRARRDRRKDVKMDMTTCGEVKTATESCKKPIRGEVDRRGFRERRWETETITPVSGMGGVSSHCTGSYIKLNQIEHPSPPAHCKLHRGPRWESMMVWVCTCACAAHWFLCCVLSNQFQLQHEVFHSFNLPLSLYLSLPPSPLSLCLVEKLRLALSNQAAWGMINAVSVLLTRKLTNTQTRVFNLPPFHGQ